MTEEQVTLERYNAAWPKKFEAEKQRIENVLAGWIDGGVQHVGSTAVPGLSAKPIIDIMVGVKDLQQSKACIPLLESIGYCYFPYKADIMHWFCKPSPEHREYHLYLIEQGSAEWQARLAFRDYLRAHDDVAQEYERLKKTLARKHANDREAYTLAKTSFVQDVTRRALSI